jgi:hypothetical protein
VAEDRFVASKQEYNRREETTMKMRGMLILLILTYIAFIVL